MASEQKKIAIKEVVDLCNRAILQIEALPEQLKKGSSQFHNGKVAAYRELIGVLTRMGE